MTKEEFFKIGEDFKLPNGYLEAAWRDCPYETDELTPEAVRYNFYQVLRHYPLDHIVAMYTDTGAVDRFEIN